MKAASPLKLLVVLPFAFATVVACGGGGQQSLFHSKCELACRSEYPTTNCDSRQTPEQCTNDCDITTAGLSTGCAQCVVDNTYGQGFSASGDGGVCYTYSVQSPTGSNCKDFCALKDGGL